MRRFLFFFFAFPVVIGAVLLVGGIIMDPHWIFDAKGAYNSRKYPYDERAQKTNYLVNAGVKYDGLLIGSSRSGYINVSSFGGGRFFNYSLAAMYPYEYPDYIEVARHGRNISTVIIGLDFYATNRNRFWVHRKSPEYYIERARNTRHLISQMLSIDSIKYMLLNWECSMASLCRHDYYDADYVKHMYFPSETERMKGVLDSLKVYNELHYGSDYVWDDGLETIFRRIKEKNPKVRFIVFTTPTSAPLFSLLVKRGLLPMYEKWIRLVVSEFGAVYDFMGINSVTSNLSNFRDTDHFKPAVGEMIINRIAGAAEHVPFDFGVLVDARGIEAHLSMVNNQALLADPDPISSAEKLVQSQ